MEKRQKPKIAVTMGDPSGIGPETILKSLTNSQIFKHAKPIIIGDGKVLEHYIQLFDYDLNINRISSPENYTANEINLLDIDNVNISNLKIGEMQAQSGQASYDYIERATKLALEYKIDGISTAPIHKEALKKAGIGFKGCTEILGHLTNTDEPLTMFAVENLRIFFLTRHLSLSNAINEVKKDKIVSITKSCIKELKKYSVSESKFAIAGLNPHCSDGGLFGDEESNEIKPAIEELQEEGYNVIGPIGADSIFHLSNENNWAGVLSLYHDQGHIAAKTLDFNKTTSITLGLPFLRTSVDHGVAFDISGENIANSTSMEQAIFKASYYLSKRDNN